MTTDIPDLMAQTIALAKEQHGEREYKYTRIAHRWSSSRKRGQKGQYWTTIGGGETVTREDYEANVAQGNVDSTAAFRGKLTKMIYYHYHREKVGDGWQDALIAIVEEVPA